METDSWWIPSIVCSVLQNTARPTRWSCRCRYLMEPCVTVKVKVRLSLADSTLWCLCYIAGTRGGSSMLREEEGFQMMQLWIDTKVSHIKTSAFQNICLLQFWGQAAHPVDLLVLTTRNMAGKVKGYWFLFRHPQLSYITLSHSAHCKQPAVMSQSVHFQQYNIGTPLYLIRPCCSHCLLVRPMIFFLHPVVHHCTDYRISQTGRRSKKKCSHPKTVSSGHIRTLWSLDSTQVPCEVDWTHLTVFLSLSSLLPHETSVVFQWSWNTCLVSNA